MHAVFLDKNTFSNAINFTLIERQLSSLRCYDKTTESDVISRCADADIIITNKVLLTAEVLSQLPNVKLICITATGYNNVDIEAAKQLGIAVTNVSGYAGASVAQYVFAQLLEYYQQISHHNDNTERGLWSSSDAFCYHGNGFRELAGKTIGIVGYGNLGKAIESIASAFNMNVMVSERPQSEKIRAGRFSFAQVISQADIVSLHCPQTPETENCINAERLSNMKPSAVLVNTARGALIDEQALLNALRNNDISYAILDVLSQEPPPASHPLINTKLTNLKITAHIAWASIEAQQRLIDLLSQNITSFTQGERFNRLD